MSQYELKKNCSRLTAAILTVTFSTSTALHVNAAENTVIEEILVTAQKREQSITETPIAVQAFGEQQLSDSGIRNINDLITFVPGASEELSQSQASRRYQIRGVTQGILGDSTIGYYIGETAYPTIGLSGFAAPAVRSFDLQRVEVLRGPQSTLYGNGAMGGVIRFIPNEPSLTDFEGLARAGAYSTQGGDDSYYADAAISMPLVKDRLGLRLTAGYEDVGGRLGSALDPSAENIDDAELTSFRANLKAVVNDRMDLSFLYYYNKADTGGTSLQAVLEPPISNGAPSDFVDTDFELISATVSYDLGFADLTSTTAYLETTFDIQTSFAPGIAGAQNIPSKALNNETRLTSQQDGPLNWIAGVFYNKTEESSLFEFIGLPFPGSLQDFESEAISVFGEVSYELLDGKLIPLIGLRYFTDDRDTVTADSATGIVTPGSALSDEFDSVNPRLNLSYLPDDNSLYYLNIAKGFRSGTFNISTICGADPICELAIDSDTIWSYEVGAKKTVLNGQMFVDAALYYQDWSDNRQPVPVITGVNALQELTVGDAESYGLDLGITAYPNSIEGLSIQLAANINTSEFTSIRQEIADHLLARGTVVQEGDDLPFVPEWTLALSLNYENEFSSNMIGSFNVGYRYIEGQPGQFAGIEDGDNRGLLNARLGVKQTDGGFGVYLFGQNLLNEQGAVFSQTPSFGGVTAFTQDRSRTVGLEASYSF